MSSDVSRNPVSPAPPVLTWDQYRYVIECFDKWLRLRAKHEPRFADTLKRINQGPPYQPGLDAVVGQLSADIWHSALLSRMLVEGKPPLAEPPPTLHSYPNYAAVEGEPE